MELVIVEEIEGNVLTLNITHGDIRKALLLMILNDDIVIIV